MARAIIFSLILFLTAPSSPGTLVAAGAGSDEYGGLLEQWSDELTVNQIQVILDNFAHETVICIAYYDLVKEGLRNGSADDPLIVEHEKLIGVLTNRALILQDTDLAMARLELATKKMALRLNGKWARISILINEHGALCKESAELPIKRLGRWRSKLYGE